MIVFSIISTKGGVGKTTLTANLGALLADFGLHVLMIDADYQPSLSRYFELSHRAPSGLTALFKAGVINESMISHVRLPSEKAPEFSSRRLNPVGKLHLVYSDAAPSGEVQSWLRGRIHYLQILRTATHSPALADQYDVILIDTQGAAGHLQQAAIVAADKMIHPVSPDTLSAREFLTATSDLLDQLNEGGGSTPVPPILAVLYRQSNTNNARAIAATIRQEYIALRGSVTVANTTVPLATAFEQAATKSVPVHWLEPKRAGLVLHQLAWELLPHMAGINVSDVVATANDPTLASTPQES
jgi:chromosome partitioning related protein ParA